MPRTTCKYRFEWKIIEWAMDLSHILTGDPFYAFFIVFTENGLIEKVILGDRPQVFDREELQALQQEASSWFFYHPFDPPEYGFIAWQNVDRRTMERFIKDNFEPNDFVGRGVSIEFPTSWSVVF